jgi:hypothetical protein
MIQTFTLDDVVRYVYQEMSSHEAQKMKEALLFDSELMDLYQQLEVVKKTMENTLIEMSPPQRVVDKILDYSKTHDLQVTSQ